MDSEEKKNLIAHLVDSYNSGEKAIHLDITYSVINRTFWMIIDGQKYALSSNEFSDFSDGVGDEFASKVKVWAK